MGCDCMFSQNFSAGLWIYNFKEKQNFYQLDTDFFYFKENRKIGKEIDYEK
jgi:hypothetical protein